MDNGGQSAQPPAPKNVANWQTQFFFGRSFHWRLLLWRHLSLPTVANSVAKWQSHFGSPPQGLRPCGSSWLNQDFASSLACVRLFPVRENSFHLVHILVANPFAPPVAAFQAVQDVLPHRPRGGQST